jgi:NADH:ubiquinone oxidoreductase subunit 4 (subunit M)
MHGPPVAREPDRLVDVTPHERLVFAPLVALIFIVGLHPQPLLDRSAAAVQSALQRLERPAGVIVPVDEAGRR